ncbi:heme biosynthesis protein [Ignicoccus pacificus DSM 13166]|uniref:Heme biosynthesis protein n=1 Tax=Ignicoccus pacificus DSM 13166 TaxID=940294 RepID=A0A977PKC5_9CREN|nr:heme biosynthesis protein [Ignicoccus pacificus DSM 13166]
MSERGGMSALLTGIRVGFNNPITRTILKKMSKRITCIVDGKPMTERISYFAMAKYAGLDVKCPWSASLYNAFLSVILDVALMAFKGNKEEVREALKDPAVRRGMALVLEGLGKYGVTVPQKLPAPFLIVWNFTNMCNLRCKHCYQRADKPLPDELTLDEKLDVVRQFDEAGVAAVALSGGEPTIHPHFYKVVEAFSERGIYVAVATNGWLFADKKYLVKAKEKGVRYIEVSVDSADPKKHDEFRGIPGSWKRAVQTLRNAVDIKLNHAMAVTVTKNNIDEIDDILNLAEEIGVWRVVFFNFVPVGRGKEIMDLDLSPEEREEFMKKIAKEMTKRKMEIYTTAPQYSRVTMEVLGTTLPTHFSAPTDTSYSKVVSALAEFVGGCGAGRIYAALEPNGDVTPCVFLPIVVGNVRQKHFREIWETSELFLKLRDRNNLSGYCKVCPYREVCGGCRARAYAYFNDPLAPDPGCIFNKSSWEELKKQVAEVKVL